MATLPNPRPFTVLLGLAQDGGYPQAGCAKACCHPAWGDPGRRRRVTSLAVVEPATGRRWLVDCTPDFPEQLRELDRVAPTAKQSPVDGILLTHAHVGHYVGLVHLGREAMAAEGAPVYAMPRMAEFLRTNAPWNELVQRGNIELHDLGDGKPCRLSPRITITPWRVPHRAELSETVGFQIDGADRRVLYVPDVDDWPDDVERRLSEVDVAWLDGTFFDDGELPRRDMAEIAHPTICHSMERFAGLPPEEQGKVRFIHLNHTNPAMDPNSAAREAIHQAGYHVAEQGERWEL